VTRELFLLCVIIALIALYAITAFVQPQYANVVLELIKYTVVTIISYYLGKYSIIVTASKFSEKIVLPRMYALGLIAFIVAGVLTGIEYGILGVHDVYDFLIKLIPIVTLVILGVKSFKK